MVFLLASFFKLFLAYRHALFEVFQCFFESSLVAPLGG